MTIMKSYRGVYLVEEIENFNKTLFDFKINAKCVDFKELGPTSVYKIKLDPSTKIKKIESYNNEISISLKKSSNANFKYNFETGTVDMEFINFDKVKMESLSSLMSLSYPSSDMRIPILLGRDYYGLKFWFDLAESPHMIVAGSTGSGKTVALHNIIGNLLKWTNCDISIIDPKVFEFSKYLKYNNIKVYSSYEDALQLLEKNIAYMEGVFNKLNSGTISNEIRPKIIIIDEYAELSLKDKSGSLYKNLCLLAQKCRAAKIHIILSTQRPSSKLIDGNIKANFPARLAFKVPSRIDSKIIIDSDGAENLLGKGDCFIINNSNLKKRLRASLSSLEDNENIFQ